MFLAPLLVLSTRLQSEPPVLNKDNGHYYQRIDKNISWKLALDEARNMSFNSYSGHLATLSTAEENNFVIKNLGGEKLMGHWLGGYKRVAPDGKVTWRWITGELATFTPFGPGEPNNNGGNEDALQFHFTGQFEKGKWNDLPQSEMGTDRALGYVVEYEPEIASVVKR